MWIDNVLRIPAAVIYCRDHRLKWCCNLLSPPSGESKQSLYPQWWGEESHDPVSAIHLPILRLMLSSLACLTVVFRVSSLIPLCYSFELTKEDILDSFAATAMISTGLLYPRSHSDLKIFSRTCAALQSDETLQFSMSQKMTMRAHLYPPWGPPFSSSVQSYKTTFKFYKT